MHNCVYCRELLIFPLLLSPSGCERLSASARQCASRAGGVRPTHAQTSLHNTKVFSIKRFLRALKLFTLHFGIASMNLPLSGPSPSTTPQSLILRLYPGINIVYIDKVFLPAFILLFSFASECLKNCQWRLWAAPCGPLCSVLLFEGLQSHVSSSFLS